LSRQTFTNILANYYIFSICSCFFLFFIYFKGEQSIWCCWKN